MNPLEVSIDKSAACLFISGEDAMLHCYKLSTNNSEQLKQGADSWEKKTDNASRKCQSKFCLGQSTLLQMIYEARTTDKCDKNSIIVHVIDFL